MANSQLYNVLSGLNTTDNKIYNKLTALSTSFNNSKLSGDNTTIGISSNTISVKDGGISVGKLSSDVSTKLTNAAALTGLVAGSNVTIGTGAKPTVSVATSGKFAANDTGIVSGGLLYSKINDLDGIILSGVSVNGPLSATTKSNKSITIGIKDGTTSQKGAVQLTNSITSGDSSKAATPKAVYDYTKNVIDNLHTHTNLSVLSGISATQVSNWDSTHSTVSTLSAGWASTKSTVNSLSGDWNSTKSTVSSLSGKWEAGAAVSAVTLSTVTTVDGYAASYKLVVNGTAVGSEINITKDQFLSSVQFGYSTADDSSGANWDKSSSDSRKYPTMKFIFAIDNNHDGTVETTPASVFVPLSKLVDEYKGGSNIKVDGRTISLSGVIPSSSVPTIPSSKLSSDIQTKLGYADDYNTNKSTFALKSNIPSGADSKVMVATTTVGKVAVSSFKIGATDATSFGSSTELATESGAKAYVDAEIDKLETITNIALTGVNDATANDAIVLSLDGRNVKLSAAYTTDIATDKTSTAKLVTPKAVYDYANTKLGYASAYNTMSGNFVRVNNDGNLSNGQIVIAAGDNKTIKTGYSVVDSITGSSTSGQIATAKAVYDHNAYILNGTNGTTTGVEDWGRTSGEGSLADILTKINTLNASIN